MFIVNFHDNYSKNSNNYNIKNEFILVKDQHIFHPRFIWEIKRNMKVNLNIFGEFQNNEQELRDYAFEKACAYLKSNRKQIKNVIVNIFNIEGEDINAHKRCSIHLFIPGQLPVEVRIQNKNIFTAITRAIEAVAYKTNIRTRQRVKLANI